MECTGDRQEYHTDGTLHMIESVTPVPKLANPKSANDLRKIAALLNLSKLMEKIIVKYLVEDMKERLDTCQYANQANQSI